QVRGPIPPGFEGDINTLPSHSFVTYVRIVTQAEWDANPPQEPQLPPGDGIIVLSAGHWGNDNPFTHNGQARSEAADNLAMALAVQTILQNRGHTVRMTRTGPNHIANRAQWARNQNPDIFVSLHRNGGTPAARGLEMVIAPAVGQTTVPGQNPISSASANSPSGRAAQAMQNRIWQAWNQSGTATAGASGANRGVRYLGSTNWYSTDPAFRAMRASGIPVVVPEIGFYTNHADNILFDRYMQDGTLPIAIAEGIIAALGS
ncbi:MAG: N-acetylmuramoyl-L-alanine amidase, partial [Firmicutes bacterium]|nr:N-acetylmuramoyl-L-alanine amidase [Bacillota bacterium]